MAYGQKYSASFFSDIEDFEYDIYIYKEGYASTISTLTVGNVSINRGESDMLQPIKGSEAIIEVVQNTNFTLESEFGTANYGDYFVEIYRDPSGANELIWQGYNIPNTFTEPYEDTPYLTELKFNCGLGHLKYKKFEDSGTIYSGQKAILEVLRLCLNKLPNASTKGQSIRESVNIFETDLYSGSPAVTDSMINSIYVDSGLYKEIVQDGNGNSEHGWDCYRVLEEILKVFNARLYSWRGYWYIDQLREQKETTIYYRDFLPRVGSESTLTVDSTGGYSSKQAVNSSTLWPTSEGEISILPALEKLKYKYNTQNVDYLGNDLLTNGDFKYLVTFDPATYPNSSGYPFYFTYNGVNPATYNAIFGPGSGLGWNWFQFNPTTVNTASTFNSSNYLRQQKTGIGLANSDTLRISFRTYMELDWTAGAWQDYNLSTFISFIQTTPVYFKLKIKIGSYYLSGTPQSCSWTTTDSYITVKRTFQSGLNGDYPQSNSSGTCWNDLVITFDTPTLPVTAVTDLDFYIYQPFHEFGAFTAVSGWDVDFDTFYYGLFSMNYVPAAAPPTEEIILEHEIDEEAEELSIEVVHGDGPVTVSQGSLRLSNGLITNEWARYGVAETKGIAEIWIEDISELRSSYTRLLNWSLYGWTEMYNTITHQVDAVTTVYLVNGFNWNLSRASYELSLIKLQSYSRSAFTSKQSNNRTALPVLSTSNNAAQVVPLNTATQRTSFSQATEVEDVSVLNYAEYLRTAYVGYYTFNENSTTTIRDYSQAGNDGTGANLTVSATTRTIGKDAVFNGTTSKIDFTSISDFDSISSLGVRIAVNPTSNTGTDTIFNLPGVLSLSYDGSNFIGILSTTAGDYTVTAINANAGTWFDVFLYWYSNTFYIYSTDNALIFETDSIATSGTTNAVGSITPVLGYSGSTAYAAFKCNELQIRTGAFTKSSTFTAYIEEQNGVLITADSSNYNVGDIIASDWDGDLNSAIVTYVGTDEFAVLPVDGQFYGTAYPLERVGHLWDSTRQWMFVINNTPSICFYDGINLTTLIADSSTKVYCLNTEGIIENSTTLTSNTTITNNDSIIYLDSSGGAFTVTLPPTEDATPTNKIFTFIDKSGNCTGYNVTIDGGDYNINGEANLLMDENYISITLIFNGTQYNIK